MKKSVVIGLFLFVLIINIYYSIAITPQLDINEVRKAEIKRAIFYGKSNISLMPETNNSAGKLIINFSNGRKAEIKIMPETASQRAIERFGELGFNITLKEVGNGENAKAVYELTAEKQGKFLGLFKIKGNVAIQVDAETGEVVKVKKPWWAFLATGI